MIRLLRLLLKAIGTVLVLLVAVLATFRYLAERREIEVASQVAPRSGTFVSAGDVTIYVQQLGPRDGPAVLLMHGTGAWSETWRSTMQALAARGFRAIAIDLPPFGYSDRKTHIAYTKAAQGRRILAALDSLHVDRVIGIGHSFGAGPLAEAALEQPARFRGLIFVDAALGIRADSGAVSSDDPVSAKLVRSVLHTPAVRDSLVATFATNPLFTRRLVESFIAKTSHASDEQVELYQRPLTVEGTTPALGQWLPELVIPSVPALSEDPAAYAKLTMPVGIIWGRLDTITPMAQANELTRLLPQSQLVVIDDVGHIPQLENPERFDGVLLPLLSHVASMPTS